MGKHNKNRKRLQDLKFDLALLGRQHGGCQSCEPMDAKSLSKHSKKKRKKNKKHVTSLLGGAQSPSVTGSWHEVVVYSERPQEKLFIMTSIGSLLEVQFEPLGFHGTSNSSRFYLENNPDAADAITALDNRLQGEDKKLLRIKVNKVASPTLVLNSEQLQTVQQVMAGRFDPAASVLDLTQLHKDPVLAQRDILATLSSSLIFKQVLKIVKSDFSQLKALNLSGNAITNVALRAIESLYSVDSQLMAINLQDNWLESIKDTLNILKKFPLLELCLIGNPVLKTLQNPVIYIRTVLKQIPKLDVLDKVNIEAFLARKREDSVQPSTSSSSSNSSGVSLTEASLRTYLDQYYACIDSPEQRLQLVQAYTSCAKVEIDSTIEIIPSGQYQGHSSIQMALMSLPATSHVHSSFTLNIASVTPTCGQLEICGQCLIHGNSAPVNFKHAMNIIPYNSGLCCSMAKVTFR